MTNNELTHAIIGAAIEVHRQLGPGLLESAYEACLESELALRNLHVDRQLPVPVVYKDLKLECGYRIDLVVERKVVVELKCVEAFAPVHEAIMLTYLRLSGFPLGLLINFNVTVLKNGIKRFVYRPVEERKTLRRVPQRDAEDTEKNA
ncbi:MAG TPA: GxxExxY protein [Candidatus Acidoferrum sp.]|jgi:GxxExxY protein